MWFDDPRKFGLRKLCVGDRCLTFVWVGDRVSAPRCIITDTMVGPKTKVNSYFKKGEIYCGGKARGTLAHRWMSTPSLVELGSLHTKLMVDLYVKKIEIFDICSGFLKIL